MRSIYWSVDPRATGSAHVVLTWFFSPASTEFPAPPSTDSLIKTFSTLKVSPAHMASPVVPSRDTATFWQERIKPVFSEEPSKWNPRKLQPAWLSSGVCSVSPQHMRRTYKSHVCTHVPWLTPRLGDGLGGGHVHKHYLKICSNWSWAIMVVAVFEFYTPEFFDRTKVHNLGRKCLYSLVKSLSHLPYWPVLWAQEVICEPNIEHVSSYFKSRRAESHFSRIDRLTRALVVCAPFFSHISQVIWRNIL